MKSSKVSQTELLTNLQFSFHTEEILSLFPRGPCDLSELLSFLGLDIQHFHLLQADLWLC